MENLTQTYAVVKPDVSPAPQAGYKVVVFEKTRGGTTFRTILDPGDSPIKIKSRLFGPPPSFSCFAVNSDTNLNFDFETEMIMAAQHQKFTLKCTVYFYISSPKLMALVFKTDPIKRIKEEVEKRLKKNILQSKIKIQQVQDNFYEIKEKILSYATLNQLRDFAGEFGVIIKEVDMTYKVPKKYLQPGIKEDDYFLKKKTAHINKAEKIEEQEGEKEKLHNKYELRKIERSHENELEDIRNTQEVKSTHHKEEMKDVESFHDFRRKMPKLLHAAIEKVVQNIDSPESLEKAANASIGVMNKVATEIQSPKGNFNGKQLTFNANEMEALTTESSDPLDEAIQFLLKIQSQVENFTTNTGDKNVMLSCISHLLGEIRLGKNADLEIIDKYIDKLKNYAIKYRKVLPRYVLEQISKFKDRVHQIITGTSTPPG